MKILKKTIIINTFTNVTYPFENTDFSGLNRRLKSEFLNHGNFYEKAFGVNKENAGLAGWHPEDSDFDTTCGGWEQFLKDKGEIQKTEKTEFVELSNLLFS
jgi:hypothetical protein